MAIFSYLYSTRLLYTIGEKLKLLESVCMCEDPRSNSNVVSLWDRVGGVVQQLSVTCHTSLNNVQTNQFMGFAGLIK